MAMKPFDGPKAKLRRAREHAADLRDQIERFLANDPAALLLVRDNATKKCSLLFTQRTRAPLDLSMTFGDAIHNFRTSLDFLANDLVALNGVVPKRVYFPFAENKDGLEEQIRQKMRGASPEAVEMIRALAPYKGGNRLLRALHDLDIADKHIAMIETSGSVATPPIPLAQIGPTQFRAKFGAYKTEPIDLAGFPAVAHLDKCTVIGKVVGASYAVVIGHHSPFEWGSAG